MRPSTTRLRYFRAKQAETIVDALNLLGTRIQIYGAPVFHPLEKKWYVWFVPADDGADIPSKDLEG